MCIRDSLYRHPISRPGTGTHPPSTACTPNLTTVATYPQLPGWVSSTLVSRTHRCSPDHATWYSATRRTRQGSHRDSQPFTFPPHPSALVHGVDNDSTSLP